MRFRNTFLIFYPQNSLNSSGHGHGMVYNVSHVDTNCFIYLGKSVKNNFLFSTTA